MTTTYTPPPLSLTAPISGNVVNSLGNIVNIGDLLTTIAAGGGGGGGGGSTSLSATATAAAPGPWTEGSSQTLSLNLNGVLRVFDVGPMATAIGLTTDAVAASPTTAGAASMISLLKQIANNTTAASSNAIVPVQVVDDTGLLKQPTGDDRSRSIYTVTGGLTADGVAGVASAVLVGGLDSGGLVRTGLMNLLTATPTGSAVYGITTFSQVTALGTGNVSRGMVSGQGIGDASSGATTLGVAPTVWNGTSWDRRAGSAAAGAVNRPYALPGADWNYHGASGGITTATTTVLKAAVASVRAYLTKLSLENNAAAGTEFEIRDGATAVFFGYIPANSGREYAFPTPLKTTVNTAMNLVTASGSIVLYANAQGYTAA